jgi:hypothetical protein
MKESWSVIEIPHYQAYPWLLKKHYAKRIPNIMYSYGLFVDGVAQGVITYGTPPSPALAIGLCGEQYKDIVLELNRLCLDEGHDKNLPSSLVSRSLKMLPRPSIVVSYADTSMGHIGYVYQATNFLYTGLSDQHSMWHIDSTDGVHSRHIFDIYGGINKAKTILGDKMVRGERPRKHRYVQLIGSKTEVKQMRRALNYPICSYPKGTTNRYNSGGLVGSQMAFGL